MTEVVTDTKTITISIIIHADCAIANLVYPAQVEANEAFNIEYDCINNGEEDTCFGKLVEGTTEIDEWSQTIGAGETVHKVINMSDGISAAFNGTLTVGYVK